jgi:hypothetical protein
MGNPPPEPELVISAVPALFGDVPLPPDTRVLGGVQRGDSTADLVADSEATPAVAVQFVSDALKAQGWTEPPNMSPGGFIPVGMTGVTFCKSKDGPSLSLMATKRDDGLTKLRYTLNTFKGMPAGTFGPCNQPPGGLGFTPLPQLTSPEDAKQSSLGMSGSQDSLLQFAVLETQQTPAQLLAHYVAQLEDAGWTLTASGGTDESVWSNWAFKDPQGKDQTGMLLIAPRAADTRAQFVLLEVTMKR